MENSVMKAGDWERATSSQWGKIMKNKLRSKYQDISTIKNVESIFPTGNIFGKNFCFSFYNIKNTNTFFKHAF